MSEPLYDLATDAPEFVDPPRNTRQRGKGKWINRLVLLKERPGEWARWKEVGATNSGGQLSREARAGTYGPGLWEFTNRTVDGERFIYCRYTPEGDS